MMLLDFLFFATVLPMTLGALVGALMVINEPVRPEWGYGL